MTEHQVAELNDKEFRLFQTLIEDELGIFLARTKAAMLGNRLWKRLEETGCHNYSEYYSFIREPSHHDELQRSLELVTTNETYFFREQKHFEFLENVVIPEAKAKSKKLRIWSAACSSGEEPYSIVMTLKNANYSNWELIATDVNQKVIDKAIEGIYLDQRMHCTSNQNIKAYFKRGVDDYSGYLRVKPEIRNKVDFRKHNLMKDFSSLGRFDVIFLRNVMIYFEQEAKKILLKRIWKSLNPGGWLLTGHSESLHGLSSKLHCLKPAIYYRED